LFCFFFFFFEIDIDFFFSFLVVSVEDDDLLGGMVGGVQVQQPTRRPLKLSKDDIMQLYSNNNNNNNMAPQNFYNNGTPQFFQNNTPPQRFQNNSHMIFRNRATFPQSKNMVKNPIFFSSFFAITPHQ